MQPGIALYRRLAIALNPVALTAHAAFAGGTFDELFGTGDRTPVDQVLQLAIQMRARRFRRIPGPIATKSATGRLKLGKQ